MKHSTNHRPHRAHGAGRWAPVGTAASPSPSAPASAAADRGRRGIGVRVGRAPSASRPPPPRARRAAARAGPGRGRHPERRAGRDRSRSGRSTCRPTFDQYIKDTIARFQATYPGVTVKWEDHQAHVQGRPEQRVRRGQRARRHQPVGQRGLGQRVRGQGPAPRPRQQGPEGRPGHLLPGPLEGAAGRRRELPVPVVPGPQRRADQQGASSRRPASTVASSPRPSTASRPLCKTILDKTQHRLRHPPDRQRPARPDGLRGQRQGLSTPTARPSPSTRPKASRGCRCTSTWSRPAPSTTPS